MYRKRGQVFCVDKLKEITRNSNKFHLALCIASHCRSTQGQPCVQPADVQAHRASHVYRHFDLIIVYVFQKTMHKSRVKPTILPPSPIDGSPTSSKLRVQQGKWGQGQGQVQEALGDCRSGTGIKLSVLPKWHAIAQVKININILRQQQWTSTQNR